MRLGMSLLEAIGLSLARFLVRPSKSSTKSLSSSEPLMMAATLRKGDIVLVEGNSRFSVAVKYLTQSTWSHAALYVGRTSGSAEGMFLEADVVEGVRLVPVSQYWSYHTRICRSVGLSETEIDEVVDHAMSKVGYQYDLKNIIDLARYLIRTPPVPSQWRRKMLTIGSGDPTRAICSSLIAEAFQSIKYPILPIVIAKKSSEVGAKDSYDEMVRIRHHSLYVPRDFDLSPYFKVIKPTIENGFNPHHILWAETLANPEEVMV